MAINSLGALSASSYGLSGLVSGMDTQTMVEKMLSGTQLKIDKAGQKKTTLQYKQGLYRDVAAKLRTLQSTYLSFTSGTNLRSSSFYNTMTATVKPPSGVSAAFSVTASSTAQVGNVTMDYIEQLATALTAKTQTPATGALTGTLSRDMATGLASMYSGGNARLDIKIGNTTINIQDVAAKFGGKSTNVVVDELNRLFTVNGNIAEARFVNNKLQITAADPSAAIELSDNGSGLAMRMFGAVGTLAGTGELSAAVDTTQYMPGFVVNLDGRQQTIHMSVQALRDFGAGGDASDLISGMAAEIQQKFGTGVTMQSGTAANGDVQLSFATGQSSQRITLTGSHTVMSVLGVTSGTSNKLNTGMAIKDLNFANALQGSQQTFSVNGVDFSYTSDTALSTIISDINASSAGVKISYIEAEDRFMIQNAETGAAVSAQDPFRLEQSEGNLMNVLFGAKGGANASGYGVNMPMKGGTVALEDISDGGTYTFNVNGKDYKLLVKPSADEISFTHESFADKMNRTLASAFGTMADGTQVIEFKWNDVDDSFTVVSNDRDMVLKQTKADKDNNTNLLGFSVGQSTQATSGGVRLAEAGIIFGSGSKITVNLGAYGSVEIDGATLDGPAQGGSFYPDSMTMDEVAAAINSAIDAQTPGLAAADRPRVEYDERQAAFRVMGVDIPVELVVTGGNDSQNLDNLFGQMSLSVNGEARTYDTGAVDINGDPVYESVLKVTDAGQNAIFSINGSRMERATNGFTFEGLTYSLHSTTHTVQNDPTSPHYNPTQVTVARDTEKIVEGVKEFIKLYNETVDYINGMYKAEAVYKDYAPLTAEQKAEMSESEIKLWEEKAKEGLLRNDSTLGSILQSMRSTMYSKPEGSGIAIYDLGIATSFYANDGNFLIEDESKLRSAIEADPEAVRRLFSVGDDAIMNVLNTTIDKAALNSYASPGTLVTVAGSGASDTTSNIYKQIKEVDNQLTTLETRYWNEYDRYWKQFNTMERLIQQMNSQSAWLSQQFGSGA